MVRYIKRIQFTTTILNLTFLGSQIRLVCFFTFFFILSMLLAPNSRVENSRVEENSLKTWKKK